MYYIVCPAKPCVRRLSTGETDLVEDGQGFVRSAHHNPDQRHNSAVGLLLGVR